MLNNVRIAIGVALLLLAAFAGYRFGAWRLDQAQAEITQLKQAGDEARASAQAAQQKVDAQMKALSEQQAAQEKALTAKFESDRKGLDDLLKTADSRGSKMEAQRVDAERKRVQLQKELDELRKRSGRPATADAGTPNGSPAAAPGATPAATPDATSAPGTDAVAALEAAEQRAAAEVQRLTAQLAGLKCEGEVVPDEEVLALNRAARADTTGAPQ